MTNSTSFGEDYCATYEVRAKKRQKRNRLLGALALAAALIVALPLAVGSASAGLDDGRFCVSAASTTDPEIRGQAGNCKTEAAPEPERVPVAVDSRYTNVVPLIDEIGVFEITIFFRAEPEMTLVGYLGDRKVYESPTASGGTGAAPFRFRLDPEAEKSRIYTFCYREYNSTAEVGCHDIDLAAQVLPSLGY